MANIVLGEFKPTYNQRLSDQSKYLDQLASGKRVESAGTDASSLAIASLISSQSAALSVAASNASGSQALLNVASGGLDNSVSILKELKSLATAAQSGTVTGDDLSTLNNQFTNLKSELDAIANNIRFNGQTLLNGSFQPAAVALGANAGEKTVTLSFGDVSSDALGLTGSDIFTPANANNAQAAIDSALKAISGQQSDVGAIQARVAFSSDLIGTSKENADASLSTLIDADAGESFTSQTSASVLNQATIASITHANDNRRHLLALLQ